MKIALVAVAGAAGALAMAAATWVAWASSRYLVRGQKNPRSPSPFVRGTTCVCRWGTLWLTVLLMATKLPSAPIAVRTAAATRCTRSK